VLEEGVPGETRQSVVVSRVEPVRILRAAPEALEDIGKESNVEPEVEVMIFAKVLAAGSRPDAAGVLIVIRGARFIVKVAVEGLDRRQRLGGELVL